MVAPLAFVGAVGVVVAKAFAGVWFSSRATSPLSEEWRKEFIEHSEAGVAKLEEKALAPAEWIEALRSDLTLLRAHVADGWSHKEVFDAACRVAAYLGWKHTTTGMTGVAGLAGTYAEHHVLKPVGQILEEVDQAVTKLFVSLGFTVETTDTKDEPPKDSSKH